MCRSMRSDSRKLLFDIVSAAEAIRQFCHERNEREYDADLMLRSACERQFEIIGEAMARLRDRHEPVFDRITDGAVIIGFRNRLIHGYDTVDSRIVWQVIQERLIPLAGVAQRVLDDLDRQ